MTTVGWKILWKWEDLDWVLFNMICRIMETKLTNVTMRPKRHHRWRKKSSIREVPIASAVCWRCCNTLYWHWHWLINLSIYQFVLDIQMKFVVVGITIAVSTTRKMQQLHCSENNIISEAWYYYWYIIIDILSTTITSSAPNLWVSLVEPPCFLVCRER